MPISSPLPPPASSPLSPCRCRFPPHHRRLPCESLYEDEEFVQRQLLALVSPKVFFYLGELNGALSYALGAGPLFDVSDDSDYAQTLLAKALDEHTAIQSRATGEEKTMYSGCRLLWKGCWTSTEVLRYSIWCWKVSEDAKPRCQDHLYSAREKCFIEFIYGSRKLVRSKLEAPLPAMKFSEKLKSSCHFP
ncbi:unnamed protein product [Miscanthus lutarioriparius]|uniref:26S proteasome non-ATPase regulatory subunit 1/RPN2 N-terminal domain-containing protein n=1 Tax=Miscanthus lutarioriparius TaxID=422564 RepID=A0A811NEK4_9POAL|nr:unnamed protein product [Miscanthus lutarioriparius]